MVQKYKTLLLSGYRREVIEELLKGRSKFVYQEEQLGTAHAVLMAEELLKDKKELH